MELRLSLHAEIKKSQLELLNAKDSQIRTFGWPIGLVATQEQFRPRPHPDGIRTEISIEKSMMDGRPSYDYWALRSNGDFYLLQHLVRPQQNRLRDREPERLGGLEIDDQLKLRGLLDGEVAWLCALEDFVHVGGSALEQVLKVCAVGQEPHVVHKFWPGRDRREAALYCEVCNLFSLRKEDRTRQRK